MMKYRSLAQHILALGMALILSGCLDGPYDPSGDESLDESLSLAITSPSSLSAIDTTDPAISVAGTASSEKGLLQITWMNDRGGEGIADGTDAWHTPSIELQLGDNTIVVTAEDMAGTTSSKSLVVNRESGQTGTTELAWTVPTERVDGSPLTNLAGYKIHYGRMSGIYDYEIDLDNSGLVSYVVEGLVSGDWFFAITAYDADGLVSEPSNEIVREIG